MSALSSSSGCAPMIITRPMVPVPAASDCHVGATGGVGTCPAAGARAESVAAAALASATARRQRFDRSMRTIPLSGIRERERRAVRFDARTMIIVHASGASGKSDQPRRSGDRRHSGRELRGARARPAPLSLPEERHDQLPEAPAFLEMRIARQYESANAERLIRAELAGDLHRVADDRHADAAPRQTDARP